MNSGRARADLGNPRHWRYDSGPTPSLGGAYWRRRSSSASVEESNEQKIEEKQPPEVPIMESRKQIVLSEDKKIRDEPFDICPVKMGPRMNALNIIYLRPGMLLLKGYLSLIDQVRVVKLCRDLGLGHGGFYQPGYKDGAKLHLKMMCLGKNWDPDTRMYGKVRFDGAMPPPIPRELNQMVKEVMLDSQTFVKEHQKVNNLAQELPSMSPDICIVNFYLRTGRLGLHQDKDESAESIRLGLPVVSFSIGDSAEFLYSDTRNSEKPDTLTLESGDILVFGGKSRKVFHGVSTIFPDTAPKILLQETNMRHGRLNLTFREF